MSTVFVKLLVWQPPGLLDLFLRPPVLKEFLKIVFLYSFALALKVKSLASHPSACFHHYEVLGQDLVRVLLSYSFCSLHIFVTSYTQIMQGTMPGARRRGRPRTAWMDNIKTWTGLAVEESVRMTEDRDKWRKYVHGVANPRIEDG